MYKILIVCVCVLHSIRIGMSDLVARTGRLQQLYEDVYRLVAGHRCVPYRYKECSETDSGKHENIVEVLMISSPSGPGLLFPKGGWENDETVEEACVRGELMDPLGNYYFKNKTQQDEFSPEGTCKASVYALLVTEELETWAKQTMRSRIWLPLLEAKEKCRHTWMKDVMVNGFSDWVEKRLKM